MKTLREYCRKINCKHYSDAYDFRVCYRMDLMGNAALGAYFIKEDTYRTGVIDLSEKFKNKCDKDSFGKLRVIWELENL